MARVGGDLDEFIALEMQTQRTSEAEQGYTNNSNNNNSNKYLHHQPGINNSNASLTSNYTNNSNNNFNNTSMNMNMNMNMSMRKNQPPCECCSEGARRPAVVYCENCSGHFCHDCDLRFHPSHSLVMSRHSRVAVQLAARRNRIKCKVHPEDLVTYVCTTCSVLACSECVVHGVHAGHDVLDSRKAYFLVKDRTEEVLAQFHGQAEELSTLLRRIDLFKQEVIDNTRSVKQTMALTLNEVRERLNKKEEELMAQADVFMADQVSQLDLYLHSTRDKVGMLESVAGMVKEQLEEQDEVGLIHFFTENNHQFHELSSTIASLSLSLPSISSRKCYLDVDAANAQIASLQGLHLLIAGISNDPSSSSSPPSSSSRQPINNNNTNNNNNNNNNNNTNGTQKMPPLKTRTSSPTTKTITSTSSSSTSRPSSQSRARASPSPSSYSRPSSSTRR